jgi:hypothetical protein
LWLGGAAEQNESWLGEGAHAPPPPRFGNALLRRHLPQTATGQDGCSGISLPGGGGVRRRGKIAENFSGLFALFLLEEQFHQDHTAARQLFAARFLLVMSLNTGRRSGGPMNGTSRDHRHGLDDCGIRPKKLQTPRPQSNQLPQVLDNFRDAPALSEQTSLPIMPGEERVASKLAFPAGGRRSGCLDRQTVVQSKDFLACRTGFILSPTGLLDGGETVQRPDQLDRIVHAAGGIVVQPLQEAARLQKVFPRFRQLAASTADVGAVGPGQGQQIAVVRNGIGLPR